MRAPLTFPRPTFHLLTPPVFLPAGRIQKPSRPTTHSPILVFPALSRNPAIFRLSGLEPESRGWGHSPTPTPAPLTGHPPMPHRAAPTRTTRKAHGRSATCPNLSSRRPPLQSTDTRPFLASDAPLYNGDCISSMQLASDGLETLPEIEMSHPVTNKGNSVAGSYAKPLPNYCQVGDRLLPFRCHSDDKRLTKSGPSAPSIAMRLAFARLSSTSGPPSRPAYRPTRPSGKM